MEYFGDNGKDYGFGEEKKKTTVGPGTVSRSSVKTFSSQTFGDGSNKGERVSKADFDKKNSEIIEDILGNKSDNGPSGFKGFGGFSGFGGFGGFGGDDSKDIGQWSKSSSRLSSMFDGPGGLKSKIGSGFGGSGFGSGGFGGIGSMW